MKAAAPTGGNRTTVHSPVLNALVTRVLESRAHPLLSGSLLLVRVRGRVSGRLITVPVQYAADGEDLVVVSGRPDAKRWWRNIHAADPVSLQLRGRTMAGRAWHLDPDAGPASAEAAARAVAVWSQRFPKAARRLGLPDVAGVALTLLRVEHGQGATAQPRHP